MEENMIVRFELKLMNSSPENWTVWKELEHQMADSCTKHGVSEFDVAYDDTNHVKKVTLHYESAKQFFKLITEAGITAGKHGLEVEVISQETLDNPSCNLINQHRHKYNKEVA